MAIPTDDAGWRELCRSAMPPTWSLLAEGSGGSVWKDGEVMAAIVPKAPGRSVFNSVFYRDGKALLGCLEQIADAYEGAGIRAWTVWVPEDDTATADALKAAGHELDAEPAEMAMPLSELREPDPDPELNMSEREDYEEMARLNEIAYGYPRGDFQAVCDAEMPGLRIYFADFGEEPVSTLAIWPNDGDAYVMWVATVPEARGRGVSGRLLARALGDARDAGLATTTLQSTKLGNPVYAKLGYRDLGPIQMWERRQPD